MVDCVVVTPIMAGPVGGLAGNTAGSTLGTTVIVYLPYHVVSTIRCAFTRLCACFCLALSPLTDGVQADVP